MRTLAEFAVAAGLLTLIPGPDTLLALRTALAQGRSHAVAAATGTATALAGWGLAAGVGLTATLAAAPDLYAALRWAGAAYLAYLGLRAILVGASWPATSDDPARGGRDQRTGQPASLQWIRDLRGSYLRGVVTTASNPKVGVFYLSLFPQFIPAGSAVLGYSLLLTSIHVAETLVWLIIVAVLAARLGGALRQRPARRLADRITGAAFLAFAARLALRS
jgi:threonine/homoserine/homoserine lactone efflux protein